MKKLMTLLSAATVAIGLQAADYTDTGTSFEGAARGAFDITTADDLGSNGLWSTNGSDTVTLEVTDDQSCIRPAPGSTETDWPWQYNEWSQTNSLAIKTTFGNPVTRKVQGSGYAFGLDDRESFYFDSFVKFTAFDDDPMNTAVTNDFGDAKIAVWAQEVTLEGGALQTNVFVRAGYVGGEPQSYNCGKLDDPDGWHRLTIKFIKNVYYLDQTKPSTPCFVVFVDGGWRTDSSANKRGLDEGLLASMYAGFYNSGALFPSLDQTTPDKSGLKSVSFDGQGSIDDLVFTKTAPFAAAGDGTDAVATFNGKSYSTMDALVAAVNDATADDLTTNTVKIFSNYTDDPLAFENNTGATIKIDLNGKTLAGISTQGLSPAWIIDTSAGQTGVVSGYFSVGENSIIEAGTYNGGEGDVSIGDGTEFRGGRFSTNGCELATLNSAVYTRPAGYEFVLGTDGTVDEGYFVLYADPWVEYLGAPVDGAYTIDDYTDLTNFQAGVAAGLTTAGVTFKQTADIDMTGEPAFAGIGEYAANPTGGKPFCGTYDGQGYKISNVTMTARNYGGIFNQINGGTVQNLTVENISAPADATGEYGYGIIGNAGNGATLKNLVATGSFGSAEKPGTHNMAGIAIRLSAGGTGTLVQNCTNNASIYGTYTKLAGICALTQVKVSGGAVTFDGCANNGALYLSRSTTGVTGFAGIVGYVQDDTVLVDCSNTGSLSNTVSGANTDRNGALVGWAYGKALTDNGGNSAAKTDKMVAYQTAGEGGQSITGFKFATVSGDVATTVTTLATNTTYLIEGNAAPAFEFTAAGWIAFGIDLGYTLDGAGITIDSGITGLELSVATNGTVVTYTAAPLVQEAYNAGSTINCTDATAASNLVATINADKAAHITVPSVVNDGAAYVALFEATVSGTSVTIDFTEEAAAYQATNVAATAVQAIPLADAASAATTFQPTGLTPGLYYAVVYGSSLTTINKVDNCAQAQANGTLGDAALVVPHPGNAGFFKIAVSPAPIPVTNGGNE